MNSDSDDSMLQPQALNEVYVDEETFTRLSNSMFIDKNGDRIIVITDGDRRITCISKITYIESPRRSISLSDTSD